VHEDGHAVAWLQACVLKLLGQMRAALCPLRVSSHSLFAMKNSSAFGKLTRHALE
jgi:hypothetical protein